MQDELHREFNLPEITDAEALATVLSDSDLLECESRYFYVGGPYDYKRLHEAKNVSLQVEQKELTSADDLNGVTWKASISILAPTVREFDIGARPAAKFYPSHEGKWGDWTQEERNTVLSRDYLVRDGVFKQEYEHEISRPKCSDIPAG